MNTSTDERLSADPSEQEGAVQEAEQPQLDPVLEELKALRADTQATRNELAGFRRIQARNERQGVAMTEGDRATLQRLTDRIERNEKVQRYANMTPQEELDARRAEEVEAAQQQVVAKSVSFDRNNPATAQALTAFYRGDPLNDVLAAAAEEGFVLTPKDLADIQTWALQNVPIDANGYADWDTLMENNVIPGVKKLAADRKPTATVVKPPPTPAQNAGRALGDGARPGVGGGPNGLTWAQATKVNRVLTPEEYFKAVENG